jgi:hypothetical protein
MGTLHEYVDAFLRAEETEQGIPVWGIHRYLCKQREFMASFLPPTQVLLTPGDSDVSGAIFKSLCRHFFYLFTPENAKIISIKFFIVSACLIVKNWQQAGERGMIRSYIICTLHQTLYIGMMKSRTVIWVERLVCKLGTTNAHKILVRRLEDRPLDRPRLWQEAAIKMDLTEVEFKCKCWIQMIRTILFLVAFDAVWTCR